VRERAAFWSVLAEDQGRDYSVEVPAVPLPVRCAGGDLGEAVDALLGNVFAHTEDGCAVGVVLAAEPGGGARITVEDAGQGFPGTAVVTRGTSGSGSTGLGLDIARRTAEHSGGSLVLAHSDRLGGAAAVLLLGPVQPATTTQPGTRAARRAAEKRHR
jgi:signal transduction histidine kinase